MDLFDRQPESFGAYYRQDGARPSHCAAASDALSPQFAPPPGDKAADVVRYLLAQQQQRFHTTIVECGISQGALLAAAKRLLKEHPATVIKRAVCYSTSIASSPFSFKFVKTQLPELRQKCPFL